MNMQEAVRTYTKAGGCFFKADTMKFWKSRIESELVNDEYFVTSEPDWEGKNRRYSVRRFYNSFANVETVGEFRQYGSLRMAMAAIEKLV